MMYLVLTAALESVHYYHDVIMNNILISSVCICAAILPTKGVVAPSIDTQTPPSTGWPTSPGYCSTSSHSRRLVQVITFSQLSEAGHHFEFNHFVVW